jgi:hypothetical protein
LARRFLFAVIIGALSGHRALALSPIFSAARAGIPPDVVISTDLRKLPPQLLPFAVLLGAISFRA